MAKISGSISANARLIVIDESSWTVESNTTKTGGAFEVNGLAPGKKTVISRATSGECEGFGNVTAISDTDSYTKLLLHFDEATLVDSSPAPKTLTLNGEVARSTIEKKFGGYSGSFNIEGSPANQYISIPNSTDFNFGSEDFTIDFWMLCGNQTYYSFPLSFQTSGDGSMGWNIAFINNVLNFQWEANFLASSISVVDAVWHHIAIVKYGVYPPNNFTLYVDGSVAGFTGIAPFAEYSGVLQIGKQNEGAYWYGGYIDELRISKGIARWTSTFTPPVIAYS